MTDRRRNGPRHRGRVEEALNHTLAERRDIGLSERAALRAQAFAVDLSEGAADPQLITTSNLCFLRLREAAGLTAGEPRPGDPLEVLFAELARPGPGASD